MGSEHRASSEMCRASSDYHNKDNKRVFCLLAAVQLSKCQVVLCMAQAKFQRVSSSSKKIHLPRHKIDVKLVRA